MTSRVRQAISLSVAVILIAGGAIATERLRRTRPLRPADSTVLFNQGLDPVVTGAPAEWTNESCRECHQAEYRQWAASRHRVAGINDKFAAECLDSESGRQQYCLNCHAPRVPGGRLPMEEPPGLDADYKTPPSWLADGVDCLACHVRDGVVLATRVTPRGEARHPMRVEPRLAKPEFCAGCHQFAFKDQHLPDAFHGQLQQASLEEFLEYRRLGGVESSCHDCHMPNGNHLMPGGYDDAMVRRAVGLDVEASWSQPGRVADVVIELTARRVGHRVPGGEELRFLTLRTRLADAGGRVVGRTVEAADGVDRDGLQSTIDGWLQVETLRRRMGRREHGRDYHAAAAADNRLRPGERRRFRYRIELDPPRPDRPVTLQVELWYHLMHDGKARLFEHAAHDVQRPIRSVSVKLDAPRPVLPAKESGTP